MNRAATASIVATGSACTNVAGMSADSRQPPSPSRTIRSGRARARSSVIGFDVGMAPVRTTTSGRWASIQGPGRHSWSPWAITIIRSWGPVRSPDSGSARIGNPVASARRQRTAASRGSSSGPATISPRLPSPPAGAMRRAASRSIASASSDLRPATRVVNGSDGGSASIVSGPSGSSGSRNGALIWTGPAGPAIAVATARPATERTCASVTGSPSASGSSVYHFAARP